MTDPEAEPCNHRFLDIETGQAVAAIIGPAALMAISPLMVVGGMYRCRLCDCVVRIDVGCLGRPVPRLLERLLD